MSVARTAWRAAVLACLALFASTPAAAAEADAYPSRPVRFIVPIGPGSSGDTMTRTFAEYLRKTAGHAILVVNRPGAELSLGTQVALNEPAGTFTIVPCMMLPMYSVPSAAAAVPSG